MTWDLSRAAPALLLAAVLLGGVVLGGAWAAFGQVTATPTPTATPSADPSPTAARLPDADVEGEELARLPRYPGSVRTDFEISIDDRYRLTALEYLADAGIEEVRSFYQNVMDDHGWERADVDYSAGEWTYVLVDGRTEALIEIEVWNGLVEIDLQLSEPIENPAPSSPSPSPSAPPPPSPARPAPTDDGDDDDDFDDTDTDTWDDTGDTGTDG